MSAEVVKDKLLHDYLADYRQRTGNAPTMVKELKIEDAYDPLDVMYQIADQVWVHVRPGAVGPEYHVVQPALRDEDALRILDAKQQIYEEAIQGITHGKEGNLETELDRRLDKLGSTTKLFEGASAEYRENIRYHMLRDIARYGPLDPLLNDPYLEDIQAVGAEGVHVIHKQFGMLPTNVRFPSADAVDLYLRNLSERLGRPVSDARPIVDATLGDGSRINIVYSEDVSRKGPSFSIRRVHATPISITQLISWGTLDATLAAYLWLCLENGMSIFVCGEAACGKSATLNAILPFVDPRSKIYTAEDTPEVRPPHPVWQRLLTRETGPAEARVGMFDLLRAALRSRPNYIVVGEIRGAEGAVAFQAMQTGHPTVATFHATDKVKMIQRLSAKPISIPLTFVDNLNVAVFQQAIEYQGRLIRRIVSVDEIEGYSTQAGGVMTRPVFAYDVQDDQHSFQGHNNSFILEDKIAEQHGYEDTSEIYGILEDRARVLATLVHHGIFDYDRVNELLFAYHDKGEKGLPFPVV